MPSTKKQSRRKSVKIDPEYHKNLIIIFRSTVFDHDEQKKDPSSVQSPLTPTPPNLGESDNPQPVYKRLKLTYFDSNNNQVNVKSSDKATTNTATSVATVKSNNENNTCNDKKMKQVKTTNTEKKKNPGVNKLKAPKRKYTKKRPVIMKESEKDRIGKK